MDAVSSSGASTFTSVCYLHGVCRGFCALAVINQRALIAGACSEGPGLSWIHTVEFVKAGSSPRRLLN